jgi:FkbM family methyltransferase
MGFSYAWGRYEAAAWGWFLDRLRPGATVYDIGANRGQMTLFFARAVGPTGTVVAFEPVPELFADLARNCKLNGLSQVRPYNLAASAARGEARFDYTAGSSTQGKLTDAEPQYQVDGASPITVRTCRIDDLVDEIPPPAFLKIDVEGAAGKVIAGARQTLDRCRPGIYVELHGPGEQQAIKALLQDHRYIAKKLSGSVVADPTAGWHSPLWCVPAEVAD